MQEKEKAREKTKKNSSMSQVNFSIGNNKIDD